MKTCICCIAANENRYIREWVEHYLKLGFDKIFIHDNNPINGEKFDDVIEDYINSGQVQIINVRGIKSMLFQMIVYEKFYAEHNQEYDWIAFFDCDEFLILKQDKTIQEYLSRPCFDNCDFIKINWKVFDDNDLVHYDSRPLMTRFTRCIDDTTVTVCSWPENESIKSIIKGRRKNIVWKLHPHCPSTYGLTSVNDIGETLSSSSAPHHKVNTDLAQLNHYQMKTIEEYVNIKVKRGRCDVPTAKIPIENFWKLNKRTKEKEQYLHDLLIHS